MAKLKKTTSSDLHTWRHGDPAPWTKRSGDYVAGRASIDEMDKVATAMERVWGADRLRLLVSVELREKFDRQRLLMAQAMASGTVAEVRLQAARTIAAWQALDRAATEMGAGGLPATVWEVALRDGTVVQIVREAEMAHKLAQEDRAGRQKVVYSLAEIADMLESYRSIHTVKAMFPGAEVTKIRTRIGDPLDGVCNVAQGLDDPLPDDW
jgi:hypothetical protein